MSQGRTSILHGSEIRCLKESEIGILRKTDISMVIKVGGVQLNDGEGAKEFILILGLNESIDQLAMANSVS